MIPQALGSPAMRGGSTFPILGNSALMHSQTATRSGLDGAESDTLLVPSQQPLLGLLALSVTYGKQGTRLSSTNKHETAASAAGLEAETMAPTIANKTTTTNLAISENGESSGLQINTMYIKCVVCKSEKFLLRNKIA